MEVLSYGGFMFGLSVLNVCCSNRNDELYDNKELQLMMTILIIDYYYLPNDTRAGTAL